jgi:hypothetical protein
VVTIVLLLQSLALIFIRAKTFMNRDSHDSPEASSMLPPTSAPPTTEGKEESERLKQ